MFKRQLLDGTRKTVDNSLEYQGYVETTPYEYDTNRGTVFTITFGDRQFSFFGLTIYFDSINNVYPRDVSIKGMVNSNVVINDTVSVTDAVLIYGNVIPEVDTLIITVNAGRVPYTRLRVQQIVLGVNYVFDSSNIENLEWKRSNDLIGTKLPENTLKFTFIDRYNQYNPDNPNGIWKFIDIGQKVTLTFTYALDDGTKEEIPGAVLYLTGTPSVVQSSVMSKIQFEAVSKIQMLEQLYPYGRTYDDNYNSQNAVVDILTYAELNSNEYDIDDLALNPVSLQSSPVSNLPVKQNLQLLGMCSRCVLGDDRLGKITMKHRSTDDSGFVFDLNNILSSAPALSKYPVLRTLMIKSNGYVQGLSKGISSENLICEIQVNSSSVQLYTVDYDGFDIFIPAGSPASVYNKYIETSGNVVINNINFIGPYRAEILASGTGTIKMYSNKLNLPRELSYSQTFNVDGKDCTVENNLCASDSNIGETVEWLGEILNRRNLYKFQSRGFPELDTGDIVTIQTRYSDDLKGYLVSSTVKFNGALSSEEEVLV